MVGAGKGKPRGLWDPIEDTQPHRSGRASCRKRWLSKDLKVEQELARATEGVAGRRKNNCKGQGVGQSMDCSGD